MDWEHQRLYPEQYTHPLCGKLISLAPAHTKFIVVGRVVVSRWGLLAIEKDTDGQTAYAVAGCRLAEEGAINVTAWPGHTGTDPGA